MATFAVQPLEAPFGATVRGIDPSEALAPDAADTLSRAFFEHGLLLFPDLDLTMAEQQLPVDVLVHGRAATAPCGRPPRTGVGGDVVLRPSAVARPRPRPDPTDLTPRKRPDPIRHVGPEGPFPLSGRMVETWGVLVGRHRPHAHCWPAPTPDIDQPHGVNA